MVIKVMRRGAPPSLSDSNVSDILGLVIDGKLTKEEVARQLEISPSQVDELLSLKQKFMGSAVGMKYKMGQKIMDPIKYDLAVQKIISYKGIIRPMTLDVKSPSGGSYKLRVVNIYVKPNFIKTVYDKKTGETKQVQKDNIRLYEEKVYTVNKGDIAKGSSSDGYYPDKARWSKPLEKREKIPKSKIVESEEDIIQLRKKRRSHIIKRLGSKKVMKRQYRCKCRNIKKR
jgi:hypothetical protein